MRGHAQRRALVRHLSRWGTTPGCHRHAFADASRWARRRGSALDHRSRGWFDLARPRQRIDALDARAACAAGATCTASPNQLYVRSLLESRSGPNLRRHATGPGLGRWRNDRATAAARRPNHQCLRPARVRARTSLGARLRRTLAPARGPVA
jgi:hypothetical protein